MKVGDLVVHHGIMWIGIVIKVARIDDEFIITVCDSALNTDRWYSAYFRVLT